MRVLASALIMSFLAGCVTTGPPVAGSKTWYEIRMQEIESAYQLGEIDKEEYLALKNETDQIRVDYRAQMQQRLRYDSTYFPPPGFYYRHHHHHHHRRR